MRRFFHLTLAAALLACSRLKSTESLAARPAAAQWETVLDRGTYRVTIAADRIHRSGSSFDLWLRSQYSDPRVFYPPGRPAFQYKSRLSHEQFDCPAGKIRLLSIEMYDASGAVVEGRDFNVSDWESVSPGSIEEASLHATCDFIREHPHTVR